jgi:hypothetical protein
MHSQPKRVVTLPSPVRPAAVAAVDDGDLGGVQDVDDEFRFGPGPSPLRLACFALAGALVLGGPWLALRSAQMPPPAAAYAAPAETGSEAPVTVQASPVPPPAEPSPEPVTHAAPVRAELPGRYVVCVKGHHIVVLDDGRTYLRAESPQEEAAIAAVYGPPEETGVPMEFFYPPDRRRDYTPVHEFLDRV